MIKILQDSKKDENQILRSGCALVKQKEFGTPELLELVEKMKKAASQDEDGVALAAPQIGVNKRIFVIDADRGYAKNTKWRPVVFINPEIISVSNKQELKHEGCLSVRGVYGDTWRATSLKVSAFDEDGNKFNLTADGLTAHIVQHEYDHIDGILFIDHAINLVDDPDWQDHWKKK
jgi:peptide deformylase